MRKLYFLLPGLGGKFACGGLWAELKAVNLARQICPVEVVTYRQREKETLFLDDILKQENLADKIFVLSWGFDVPKLAAKLKNYHLIYHAHSANYGFTLPAEVPIITVSRNTLGYWGQKAPHSLIYYLPNQISDEFRDLNLERDIDVLVQARKSSSYLLKDLISTLQKHCNVQLIDYYVEDLPGLFNRAKVYLYDSAEYWALQGVSEGFGLQPLEALACGCQVFSSVNGGLSDYLDPGFNCYKIAGYSTEFDRDRILEILKRPVLPAINEQQLAEYRSENILKKLLVILEEINTFFDKKESYTDRIESLTPLRIATLRAAAFKQKIIKRLR
ncbi:glycosyltransferase [Oscillatoria sp. FACHB-1406]|uniref:glycosyltransferase n=1 Tax=Oscillatoria sp. FACHB-1406 TaxID=2692846 RepID=UPI0016875E1F|nr:glycosyltransferase [Oscillatoria sp. FACHB-1406]MBD2576475.1 glycosyltransferase [Oscillatoria sp. FACHB-1406]